MTYLKRSILYLFLVLFSFSGLAQESISPYAGVSGWESSKDDRMEWFRKARFGLFIHWGLYSVAGGTWKDQEYSQDYAEWIQTWAEIPSKEYAEQLKPKFTAKDFDADKWAQLAKEAGMKYVIITSRHHDGFSIFNSKQDFSLSNNITGGTNISPKGRDLYGEVIEAFQEQGLKTGAYYSLLDWQHPDSYEGFQFNPKPKNYTPDHKAYKDYLYGQIKELATNYEALDALWVDFSSKDKQGETWGTKRILRDLIKWQPDIVINNRFWDGLENKYGDFGTPEKYIPPTGLPGMDWEVSHTMNESYGYNEHDHQWKSFDDIMRLFVETVSKGGNFLLNVGPDGKGNIPAEATEILQEIGEWMAVNSDAIYGTTASPFPALEWGYSTRKANKLYLHIFDKPSSGKIDLPLANKVTKAFALANKDISLDITPIKEGKSISLPDNQSAKGPIVIVLEIQGSPKVLKSQIKAQDDGRIVLTANSAKFKNAKTIKLGGGSHQNPNRPNAIANWKNDKEYAFWKVKLQKPGEYKVVVNYLPHTDKSGRIQVGLGKQTVSTSLKSAENNATNFKELEVGHITVSQKDLGDSDLTVKLKALDFTKEEIPEISSISLIPVQ